MCWSIMQIAAHASETPVLIEHPAATTLRIAGSDALVWLQGMATHDVMAPAAAVQRGLCLDRLGKIQAEVLTWRQPGSGGSASGDAGHFLITVCGGDPERLQEHLNRYVIMEDVSLAPSTARLYTLHGNLNDTQLEQLSAVARVQRVAWLTVNDAVLLVEREQIADLQCIIRGFGVLEPKTDSWSSWRIAAGLPAYGIDYDATDTPAVAGLVDELVSSTKGCYLGQEVVCRTQMRGAIREQVVRVELEGTPASGDAVLLASTGEVIGRLTSSGAVASGAPVATGTWGMARIKRSAIDACSEITVGNVRGAIRPRTQTNLC
jgi:folate-binding protein YgfZ